MMDRILLIVGSVCGAVDSWVCWKEGMPRKAVFRFVSSGIVAGLGAVGMTQVSLEDLGAKTMLTRSTRGSGIPSYKA